MLEQYITLPSKPKIVSEEGSKGVYEINELYPGYGHTLGNSLRRIILSSLPGCAITLLKIKGAEHEFSTITGIKEDVLNIILNLKKVRIDLSVNEPIVLKIQKKGIGMVTAGDIETPGQAKILNKDQYIAEITEKTAELNIEMTVERGIGYVAKENHHRDRIEIGAIAIDALFSPIRRVNYEVENMRVGNRTDFNKLRITLETDGSLTPKQALENSIQIMISQLKSIVGFKEESSIEEEIEMSRESNKEDSKTTKANSEVTDDVLKTRIEDLDLPARIINALTTANIRTIGGLARKKTSDILEVEGLGGKAIDDIKKALSSYGVSLKE